ncbi:hypothetical protein BH09SUM1_BH09SUM1_08220 [soil metagenome]
MTKPSLRSIIRNLSWREKVGLSAFTILMAISLYVAALMASFVYDDFVLSRISRSDLASVQKSGAPIITALEQYHTDHQAYPTALEDMSPKYLRKIPLPNWGANKWDYGAAKGKFELAVYKREGRYPEIYFTDGVWGADD